MSRTLAREVAFKALFQLDFNHGNGDDRDTYEELAIETVLSQGKKLETDNQDYVRQSVKGTRDNIEAIDAIIAAHLKSGWTLDRIASADRNVLRLAVYEMKFAQSENPLPIGIIINEAVEIVKKYGTDKSSRFINGILDAISKSI